MLEFTVATITGHITLVMCWRIHLFRTETRRSLCMF